MGYFKKYNSNVKMIWLLLGNMGENVQLLFHHLVSLFATINIFCPITIFTGEGSEFFRMPRTPNQNIWRRPIKIRQSCKKSLNLVTMSQRLGKNGIQESQKY